MNPEKPIIAISSEKSQVLWGRGLDHEDLYVENGQLCLVRVCAQGMSVKKQTGKRSGFQMSLLHILVSTPGMLCMFFSPLFSFTFNLKMYIHAFIRDGLFQDSSRDPVFCFHLMDPESVSQVWRQVHLPTELSCRAAFIFEAGYEVVQAERKHLF